MKATEVELIVVYRCSQFNAYCLLSCRERSFNTFFPSANATVTLYQCQSHRHEHERICHAKFEAIKTLKRALLMRTELQKSFWTPTAYGGIWNSVLTSQESCHSYSVGHMAALISMDIHGLDNCTSVAGKQQAGSVENGARKCQREESGSLPPQGSSLAPNLLTWSRIQNTCESLLWMGNIASAIS